MPGIQLGKRHWSQRVHNLVSLLSRKLGPEYRAEAGVGAESLQPADLAKPFALSPGQRKRQGGLPPPASSTHLELS